MLKKDVSDFVKRVIDMHLQGIPEGEIVLRIQNGEPVTCDICGSLFIPSTNKPRAIGRTLCTREECKAAANRMRVSDWRKRRRKDLSH